MVDEVEDEDDDGKYGRDSLGRCTFQRLRPQLVTLECYNEESAIRVFRAIFIAD